MRGCSRITPHMAPTATPQGETCRDKVTTAFEAAEDIPHAAIEDFRGDVV